MQKIQVYFKARALVYSNPLVYKLYLILFRRTSYELLPGKGTKLFLTAYPRSGLSFTVDWVKCWLGPDGILSHFHTPAVLKICKRNKVPTILIFREPSEAISSCVVKTAPREKEMRNVIRWELKRYLEFYEYALRNRENFYFFPTDYAIQRPVGLAEFLMREKVPGSERGLSKAEECVKWSEKRLQADRIRIGTGVRPLTQVNFRNPVKEEKKAEVKRELQRDPAFRQAEDLFHAMLQESGKLIEPLGM